MVTKRVYLEDLHFEHNLWLNELSFFEDEVNIYEHRLEDLVKKFEEKELLIELEQFQNQFIRQKEVIDQLKHDINKHERRISNFAQENLDTIENTHFLDHTGLRDHMESFRSIYGELKKGFYAFMAKWM